MSRNISTVFPLIEGTLTDLSDPNKKLIMLFLKTNISSNSTKEAVKALGARTTTI